MSIRTRMIIHTLSIVLHCFLTKTSNLTFIWCHNVRLQSCLMNGACTVMAWRRTYVCAPSRVSSHIHYMNSDLHGHFVICGYGIFLSLRRDMSYLWTLSTYDLCISFPSFFISTMWRHFFVPFSYVSAFYPFLYPSVSTLDSILSPRVSMLESIYS